MSITFEYSFLFTTAYFVILVLVSLFYATRPQNILFPYIITILLYTGTQYGTVDTDLTIYSRGLGILPVSLLNIFLFFLFIFTYLTFGTKYRKKNESLVLNRALLSIVAVVLLCYIYGFSTGISFKNVVSRYGMLNIINMYLLFLIMKWSIYDEKQLNKFIKVFVFVTSFMALYGIVRYGLFGGDPANYYHNFGKQSTTLTYFDSGQGILFGVLFVVLYHKTRLGLGRFTSVKTKWFYYFIMGLCLINILLSFRRSLWLGLGFIFLWVFLTSNMSRKVLILVISLTVLAIGSVVYKARFDESYKSRWSSGIASDITTKSGKIDIKSGRFAELNHALTKVIDISPVLGMGPWGINTPRITEYKDYDFVHSSFVHVYIKLGVIGLILYLLIFVGYIFWWITMRRKKWHNIYYKYLADAFFCGFLMEIPDLTFGTPLIIYRHPQIIAMLLAMPYLCYKIDSIVKARNIKMKPMRNIPHSNTGKGNGIKT